MSNIPPDITPDDCIDSANARDDLEEDVCSWIDCHKHLGLSSLTVILLDNALEMLYRTYGVTGADAILLSIKNNIVED
jgi:hypothetical protein